MAWMVLACVFGISPAEGATAKPRPPVKVQDVDEPARVPYYHSMEPSCPFTNLCQVTFPEVPAGKRLRLTFVSGIFRMNQSGFVALNVDARNNPIQAFPLTPFNGAFYGSIVSFNHRVDVYFEAGQSPNLEVGISASQAIPIDPSNRLTVSGYLVDVVP